MKRKKFLPAAVFVIFLLILLLLLPACDDDKVHIIQNGNNSITGSISLHEFFSDSEQA